MPTSTTRETIAANVRAEMARSRYTTRDAMQALGLSQPSTARRLRGEIPFDVDELRTIARWLDVPLGVLIGDEAAS